jgi:hypothetical protein
MIHNPKLLFEHLIERFIVMSMTLFIGGVLASMAFGLMGDPIAVQASKRKKGIYQPELRLIPSI